MVAETTVVAKAGIGGVIRGRNSLIQVTGLRSMRSSSSLLAWMVVVGRKPVLRAIFWKLKHLISSPNPLTSLKQSLPPPVRVVISSDTLRNIS